MLLYPTTSSEPSPCPWTSSISLSPPHSFCTTFISGRLNPLSVHLSWICCCIPLPSPRGFQYFAVVPNTFLSSPILFHHRHMPLLVTTHSPRDTYFYFCPHCTPPPAAMRSSHCTFILFLFIWYMIFYSCTWHLTDTSLVSIMSDPSYRYTCWAPAGDWHQGHIILAINVNTIPSPPPQHQAVVMVDGLWGEHEWTLYP